MSLTWQQGLNAVENLSCHLESSHKCGMGCHQKMEENCEKRNKATLYNIEIKVKCLC